MQSLCGAGPTQSIHTGLIGIRVGYISRGNKGRVIKQAAPS
jgi:hypothetical protein